MNAVATQILQEAGDIIRPKFKARIERLNKQYLVYLENLGELEPVFRAFHALDAHVQVDGDGDIQISSSGDKDYFIKCWKLLRSIGIRLNPVAVGETSLTQFHTHKSGLRILFSFSSTVCRRVQVGTEMKEVPKYETHCGDALVVPQVEDQSEAPPPNLTNAPIGGDDDIPF